MAVGRPRVPLLACPAVQIAFSGNNTAGQAESVREFTIKKRLIYGRAKLPLSRILVDKTAGPGSAGASPYQFPDGLGQASSGTHFKTPYEITAGLLEGLPNSTFAAGGRCRKTLLQPRGIMPGSGEDAFSFDSDQSFGVSNIRLPMRAAWFDSLATHTIIPSYPRLGEGRGSIGAAGMAGS